MMTMAHSLVANDVFFFFQEDLITFVDTRTYKIVAEEQFKFEVRLLAS